tara:strand:- start:2828 stop:3307 length:480 start_codon:yes stop_codon:yes gene_type:complete
VSTTEEKQEKIALEMAASVSKGALVEKITFAGIPILFSCVVYLMSALSSANNEIIQLKSKVAVVVNADNKAIPPQGTTIDMAQIREHLSEQISKVDRESALSRAAMTLDRERSMSAIEKSRMDMVADAAQARAAIRFDTAQMIAALDKRITLLEKGKQP